MAWLAYAGKAISAHGAGFDEWMTYFSNVNGYRNGFGAPGYASGEPLGPPIERIDPAADQAIAGGADRLA